MAGGETERERSLALDETEAEDRTMTGWDDVAEAAECDVKVDDEMSEPLGESGRPSERGESVSTVDDVKTGVGAGRAAGAEVGARMARACEARGRDETSEGAAQTTRMVSVGRKRGEKRGSAGGREESDQHP